MSEFLSANDNGTIDAVKGAFEAIGKDRLALWVRWAVGQESDKLIKFIRENYVSGQRIDVITGEIRDHIGTWIQRKRNGKSVVVQVIRPGKGIQGTHNFVGRWTGTWHEFMAPALADFGGSARFVKAINENIVKMGNKTLEEL